MIRLSWVLILSVFIACELSTGALSSGEMGANVMQISEDADLYWWELQAFFELEVRLAEAISFRIDK